MPKSKRMVDVKYSHLKWGVLNTLFATTLVSATAGIVSQPALTKQALLEHCFLTACVVNAQQLAQHNACRLNVTLASALYGAYEQATTKDPKTARAQGMTAPEMFSTLSPEEQQTLFENLDNESNTIILEVSAHKEIGHMPLTCYLLAACKIAREQEQKGAISENFKKFIICIAAKKNQLGRHMTDKDLLLMMDIATKEFLYQILDIRSAQFIETDLRQRCAAAVQLVDHRNNLPL